MLKAAIYGMGRWGGRLIDSIKDSDKIRLVKGVTRNPAAHREAAAKMGLELSESYPDVLRDPKIDAIVLATPHSHHFEQIVQAARAGKHIYTEKPVTLTRDTAQQVMDAVETAGVTLSIGFNRRQAPAYLEMKRRIDAGEIGKVLHMEAHQAGPTVYTYKPGMWRNSRTEAPGGGMAARGIHTLDAMIQIGGLVRNVFAYSDRRLALPDVEIDDTTSMLLKFDSGVTGYLGTIFATAELWRVHVFGSDGWLEMRSHEDLIACALKGAPQKITLPARDLERAALEAFADGVAAGQRFVVPADEAVNGIAVLEAIVASAESGKPVPIA
jgi:predicted dehydrogenase